MNLVLDFFQCIYCKVLLVNILLKQEYNLEQHKLTSNEISILYAEDSNALRTQFATILKLMFKEVFLASNGEEGLERFLANKNIKLVITDINMPKLNGIEMIKQIKSLKPATQIIVTSAYSNNENLFDCIRAEITDFVPKPIKIAEFKDAVRKCINNLSMLNNCTGYDDAHHLNLIEKFKILQTKNSPLEFVNHYKGVPIVNYGFITQVENDFLIAKVPPIHGMAADLEKRVVFKNSEFDEEFEAIVEENKNNQIKLIDFKSADKSATLRANIRVIPSDDFEMNIFVLDTKLQTATKDISSKAISFEVDNSNLKTNMEVDVSIRFLTEKNQQKLAERINCKGKIVKLELSRDKTIGVVSLSLSKREEVVLSTYIQHRCIELLAELKKLKRAF